MIRFGLGGRRVRARVVPLLASVVVPWSVTSRLAMAEQEPAGRYVVTLTEVERFEGGVEGVTLACRSIGSCVGKARVEVQGRPYEYWLFATLSDDRISMTFVRSVRGAPDLDRASANPISVMLAPDGRGERDAALAARTNDPWETSRPYTLRVPKPPRIPLANVRVTVRRESTSEQDR